MVLITHASAIKVILVMVFDALQFIKILAKKKLINVIKTLVCFHRKFVSF